MTTSLYQLVGGYLFEQTGREERHLTGELAASIAPELSGDDLAAVEDSLSGFQASWGSRALVLDLTGVVQADSLAELNGTRPNIPQAKQVLEGAWSAHDFYTVDWLPGGGTFSGVYAEALEAGADRLGVLVVVTDARDLQGSLGSVQTQMAFWIALIATAVLIMSLFVSRMFTRPIASLRGGIEQMSRGNFATRVRVRGRSEFARLAGAFNMMCSRLEALDRSRNQFVANASHELKTPLSTMKILIETLIYQEDFAPEIQREFLSDVDKEIDRLNGIIGDLLALVQIDSGDKKVKLQPMPLTDVLTETVNRLSPLAREEGIELDINVRDQLTVQGDPGNLTQMLYNLVDNAIKYTPRGGQVKVELQRSGKKALLKVSDTGVGIPKNDLPHIFERFYRVDRARARETGGTGLGLAIVKQIAVQHGGDVLVASEEGKGSTFTVELPLIG